MKYIRKKNNKNIINLYQNNTYFDCINIKLIVVIKIKQICCLSFE